MKIAAVMGDKVFAFVRENLDNHFDLVEIVLLLTRHPGSKYDRIQYFRAPGKMPFTKFVEKCSEVTNQLLHLACGSTTM